MKYGNVIDARRDSTRRHIWLCADDYGMSPAVNVAIRDLAVRGRINATSVMVVAPSFYHSEAASLNILNATETRVAIGLHVTLTAPYQPLSRNFQPVCDGIFLSKRETVRHSLLHLLRREMLESEISSQLLAARLMENHIEFGLSLPTSSSSPISTSLSVNSLAVVRTHLFARLKGTLLPLISSIQPAWWRAGLKATAKPMRSSGCGLKRLLSK